MVTIWLGLAVAFGFLLGVLTVLREAEKVVDEVIEQYTPKTPPR